MARSKNNCWICSLPLGGWPISPVYWIQRKHIRRVISELNAPKRYTV